VFVPANTSVLTRLKCSQRFAQLVAYQLVIPNPLTSLATILFATALLPRH